jgi:hypothetical protein
MALSKLTRLYLMIFRIVVPYLHSPALPNVTHKHKIQINLRSKYKNNNIMAVARWRQIIRWMFMVKRIWRKNY